MALRKRITRLLVALAIAASAIFIQGVSETTHGNAAEAAWTQCHGTQSVHELSNPPASWPGTRAAHVVQNTSGAPWFSRQWFYTKSNHLDPTWDSYKYVEYRCG